MPDPGEPAGSSRGFVMDARANAAVMDAIRQVRDDLTQEIERLRRKVARLEGRVDELQRANSASRSDSGE